MFLILLTAVFCVVQLFGKHSDNAPAIENELPPPKARVEPGHGSDELRLAATYPTIDDYLASDLPEHDFTLTWRGYTKPGQESEACYFVDDQLMGSGEGGFNKIIEFIASVNSGKTVVIYPSYAVQRLFRQSGPLDIPLRGHWSALQKAAEIRGVKLVLVDRTLDSSILPKKK